ncbi:hypothetical protein TD95_003616, partial [Thielaviopsis punctulata]
ASPVMTADVAAQSLAAPTVTAVPAHSVTRQAQLAVDTLRPLFVDGHWAMVEDNEREDGSWAMLGDDEREAGSWSLEDDEQELRRRSGSSDGDATTTAATSSTVVAATQPLPSPMDANLDFNFTTNGGKSCPAFLNRLLEAEEFKACYPISMLLKGSSSFFTAQKQLQTIVSVLDASCRANYSSCTTYLKQQAVNLTSPDNCSEEYANQSSNIMMVYWGLVSYEPLYKATCVRDPATSMYCYASAVTNTTTTGNAYTYFMPLNSSFPTTADPTCTTCLQETMAVFQSFTDVKGEPLSYNYKPAAKVINGVCGAGFVNETTFKATESSTGGVAVATTSGGGRLRVGQASDILFLS